MLYLVSKINFEEDISKLIPSSEGSKELHKVLKSTTFSDKEVSYLEICPYLCSVGLGFLYHSLIIVFYGFIVYFKTSFFTGNPV